LRKREDSGARVPIPNLHVELSGFYARVHFGEFAGAFFVEIGAQENNTAQGVFGLPPKGPAMSA